MGTLLTMHSKRPGLSPGPLFAGKKDSRAGRGEGDPRANQA